MIVKFWDFQKRENSTAQPATAGTEISVVLKDRSSIITPVITLTGANLPSYNYCFIPAYNRYYYVRNKTWDKGVWEFELNIDVMASWKSDIGATNTYILRSSSAHNTYVKDTIYPATAEIQKRFTTIQKPWSANANSGYYILGVITQSTSASAVGGAVTYYALTRSQMVSLINDLLDTMDSLIDVLTDDGQKQIAKGVANPMQWIRSCIWVPFMPVMGPMETIKFGVWTPNGVSAAPLAQTSLTFLKRLDSILHDHPQITRGKWLNTEPYRKAVLSAGPFGDIPIDTSLFVDGGSIDGLIDMDFVTGVGTLQLLYASGGQVVYHKNYFAQIGVPIEMAQMAQNPQGFISGTMSTIGGFISTAVGAVTGNPIAIAAGAGTIINGVGDMASSARPAPGSSGVNGSFASLAVDTGLSEEYMLIVDEDNDRLGRPLCEKRLISTLSGFVQVAEGDINTVATLSEKEQIKTYLTGGFYYE